MFHRFDNNIYCDTSIFRMRFLYDCYGMYAAPFFLFSYLSFIFIENTKEFIIFKQLHVKNSSLRATKQQPPCIYCWEMLQGHCIASRIILTVRELASNQTFYLRQN